MRGESVGSCVGLLFGTQSLAFGHLKSCALSTCYVRSTFHVLSPPLSFTRERERASSKRATHGAAGGSGGECKVPAAITISLGKFSFAHTTKARRAFWRNSTRGWLALSTYDYGGYRHCCACLVAHTTTTHRREAPSCLTRSTRYTAQAVSRRGGRRELSLS